MDKENQISRRAFLIGAAAIAAGRGLADNSPAYAGSNTGPVIQSLENQKSLTSLIQESHESGNADFINNATAVLVTSVFAGCLGGVASEKINFSPKTIAAVGSAELVRLSALYYSDRHAFNHEVKALTTSLGIVSALVVISDMASDTRASVGSILNEHSHNFDIAEHEAIEDIHLGKHELPDLTNADVSRSENLSNLYKNEVVRLVAGNQALSSFLGPLSTYISGRSAADTMAPIARALTKYHYSELVAQEKKEGKVINYEDLQDLATKKADEDINGPLGYVNVKIANDTNMAGAGLIGDPPFIASLLMNRDVSAHAKVSLDGLGINQLTGTINSIVWLVKTGALDKKDAPMYLKEYKEHILNSFEALKNLASDEKIREVSFRDAESISEELAERIRAFAFTDDVLGGFTEGIADLADDAGAEPISSLQEFLREIPEPLIEFNFGTWIDSKMDAFRKTVDTEDASEIITSIIGEVSDTEGQIGKIFDHTDDPLIRSDLISSLNEYYKDENIAELNDVLVRLLTLDLGDDSSDLLLRIQKLGSKLGLNITDISSKVLEDLKVGDSESDNRVKNLSSYLNSLSDKDVKHSLNHALDDYRGIHQYHHHGDHEEKKYVLSEIGREVRDTVTTQVLAVDSIVRLNSQFLPKLAGFNEDGSVTPEAFEKAKRIILFQIMAISMVGDNVAAYFYGIQMMENLYKKYFGEEFDSNEDLKYYANAAPLLAAVVAGAGSKIGNGPNFQLNGTETRVKDKNIVVEPKPVKLSKSFANSYAVSQMALVFGLLSSIDRGSIIYDNLESAIDRLKLSLAE